MPTARCGFDDGGPAPGATLLATHGPTLLVDIGFDPHYDVTDPAPSTAPIAGVKGIHALVDTGASNCCIDSQLAIDLALPVVDRVKIGGVGGVHEANVYVAQLFVPALAYVLSGMFAGVHLSAGGQMHSVLIGRDLLANFTMVYEGLTGTVTLERP